ncbi:MAG: 50S ribosomal protein L34 [Alphaproteobacteria bacterium]|nr:50S ribosomal protein L34 [Alphaproteobacteria bacterium]
MANASGRKVLKSRRAKGRHRLTVEMNQHVKKINWNS